MLAPEHQPLVPASVGSCSCCLEAHCLRRHTRPVQRRPISPTSRSAHPHLCLPSLIAAMVHLRPDSHPEQCSTRPSLGSVPVPAAAVQLQPRAVRDHGSSV
eukprot:13724-Rhodomonas_salina.1